MFRSNPWGDIHAPINSYRFITHARYLSEAVQGSCDDDRVPLEVPS